jgi:N-acetylmuramoyl-L-alanine amidase
LRKFFFIAALVAGLHAVGSAAAASPTVLDIRVGLHGATTRLVFDLSQKVEFSVFTLSDPYRVVIDLPEVGWRLPQKALPNATGVLKRLRYGLFKPGNSRVVLDVSAPVAVNKAYFLGRNGAAASRIVIDMVKTSRKAVIDARRKLTALSPPQPEAKAAGVIFRVQRPKPARRAGKRIIVLDPGHGGIDPGAIGVSGVFEKDITLAFARVLRGKLEASGRYKVKLTRKRDIFLALRDRVRSARDVGAELFLSIHANTVRDRRVSGVSVFTLSERASDKEAALLAERENKADVIAGIDLSKETSEVSNILIDLAQREAMNQSARLAGHLVKALSRTSKLLPNTHRFAGFAVLKAPDVPAVLLELGFLSNRDEERKLKSKKHQERMATAMTRAIDTYFAKVDEALRR